MHQNQPGHDPEACTHNAGRADAKRKRAKKKQAKAPLQAAAPSAAGHTYDHSKKRWDAFDVDAALAEASDGSEYETEGDSEQPIIAQVPFPCAACLHAVYAGCLPGALRCPVVWVQRGGLVAEGFGAARRRAQTRPSGRSCRPPRRQRCGAARATTSSSSATSRAPRSATQRPSTRSPPRRRTPTARSCASS